MLELSTRHFYCGEIQMISTAGGETFFFPTVAQENLVIGTESECRHLLVSSPCSVGEPRASHHVFKCHTFVYPWSLPDVIWTLSALPMELQTLRSTIVFIWVTPCLLDVSINWAMPDFKFCVLHARWAVHVSYSYTIVYLGCLGRQLWADALSMHTDASSTPPTRRKPCVQPAVFP